MNRLLPPNGSEQAPYAASLLSRREILAALAALSLLPAVALAGRGGDVVTADSEQPLARLGARLAAADPVLAGVLARDVAAWVDANCPETPADARVRAARRTLLAADRLADEYGRRQIVRIDGWILSRSEASVCAYVHALSGLAASPL